MTTPSGIGTKAAGSPQLLDLRRRLASLQPGLVAVSGGVDSRFLACLLRRWELRFTAVFISTPMTGLEEQAAASRFLEDLGLPYRILEADPLQVPEVAANTRMRCYWCKRHLFSKALELARSLGLASVAEGSHLGDLSGFRPGRQALAELGIVSPLAEAGLDKGSIRGHMRELHLPDPDQPSSPCLLTRFAYGYAPGQEELRLVERVEAGLRAAGLSCYRLRVLPEGEKCLQIREAERPVWQERKETFRSVLRQAGLEECAVRFDPHVSGFFDRASREGAGDHGEKH